jgi:VIT1/CCC1 family predicted Fe2+/Mn2+ transporter
VNDGGRLNQRTQNMKTHSRLRTWMLPIIVVVLIAAHVIVPYLLLHTGVSVAIVSGAAILVAIKHLGLLGSLYALLRRRSQPLKQGEHGGKNDGTTTR